MAAEYAFCHTGEEALLMIWNSELKFGGKAGTESPTDNPSGS